MSDPPDIDPEVLDRLRRGLPLRMHASGRLEIGGDDVTHARIEQAIRSGLDVTEEGEAIMHLGSQWCYLTIDDTPLRVVAVTLTDDGAELRLDDGRTLALEPHTLVEDPERGLRCTVPARRSGRPLRARFTNRAQMDLAPALETDGSGTHLVLGGTRHPIPSSAT